jgi:hypothetical protein
MAGAAAGEDGYLCGGAIVPGTTVDYFVGGIEGDIGVGEGEAVEGG